MEQEEIVLKTLIKNLPAFLHYLITLDISLPRLILGLGSDANQTKIDAAVYNETMMTKLYSRKVIDYIHKKTGSVLYHMIELDTHFESKKEKLSTKELNNILKQLIGDIMEEIYPSSNDNNRIGNNAVAVEVDKPSVPKYSIMNKIIRDLFIWAILMNYTDMAKMLLAHINHRICAALIARKILMSYRDKYAIYSDKETEYTQLMEYFEDYAIECVRRCYENDQDKACELVLRQCEMFGNVTCLQVGEIVSWQLCCLISK